MEGDKNSVEIFCVISRVVGLNTSFGYWMVHFQMKILTVEKTTIKKKRQRMAQSKNCYQF